MPSRQGDTEHSDSHCRERTGEGTQTTFPGTSETGDGGGEDLGKGGSPVRTEVTFTAVRLTARPHGIVTTASEISTGNLKRLGISKGERFPKVTQPARDRCGI